MIKIAFIGDIHGKNGTPLGRLQDYNEDLYAKLEWIVDYCNSNDILKIVHLGDIHDKWDVSDEWKNRIIKILRGYNGEFLTLIGNHDEPYGSEKYHYQTCLHNLELAGVLKIFNEPEVLEDTVVIPLSLGIKRAKEQLHAYGESQKIGFEYIFCAHHFYEFGLCPEAGFVKEDLQSYMQQASIILGHDHKQYDTSTIDMMTLYRPGSLMRTELSEETIKQRPRILVYDNHIWNYVEVPHRTIDEIYNVQDYRNRKSDVKLFRSIQNNLESVGKYFHNSDTIIPCSQALKELGCPIEEYNYLKAVYQQCAQAF